MSVVFVAPGQPMRVGSGRVALWRALRSGATIPSGSAVLPNTVSGLSGWWDAGDPSTGLGITGTPIPAGTAPSPACPTSPDRTGRLSRIPSERRLACRPPHLISRDCWEGSAGLLRALRCSRRRSTPTSAFKCRASRSTPPPHGRDTSSGHARTGGRARPRRQPDCVADIRQHAHPAGGQRSEDRSAAAVPGNQFARSP